MRKNENLARAKKAKNDEFYTQWHDIENEMNHCGIPQGNRWKRFSPHEREREREFNRTFAFLCDENTRADEQSERHQSKRPVNVCTNHDSTQEPIDILHPLTTNLSNGLINDCTIHGKKTYIRMLIRAKLSE